MVSALKVSAVSCPGEMSLHCTTEILRWDDQTESWTVVGMMETGRYYHAMVAVTADADTFCSDVIY